LASRHKPGQFGVMRPSGDTPVASMISSPAPLCDRPPKCIMCQSPTLPSVAEYWHIGAITMRFARVSWRRWKGLNSGLVMMRFPDS